jgi:hypothetical protein
LSHTSRPFDLSPKIAALMINWPIKATGELAGS